MATAAKRPKVSADFDQQADFVKLGVDGHGHAANFPSGGPQRPEHNQSRNPHYNRGGFGPRPHHAPPGYHRPSHHRQPEDRPKLKHALPGYEPWILVRTKLRRQFVHNLETKESLWRVPDHVKPGVAEFEVWEKSQQEKTDNAKWAEEQFKEMQEQERIKKDAVKAVGEPNERSRRRRSESLQREDEEALMAELAAEAARAESEADLAAAEDADPAQQQSNGVGYDSEGSYEEVEVTDSEGEQRDEAEGDYGGDELDAENNFTGASSQKDTAMEFGEDDIAYQLAAMEEEYGLDHSDLDSNDEGEDDDAYDEPSFTDDDAINLFRELLDDHHISPFTPWDKVIADTSAHSILHDDRYTILPTMRARKDVFDLWVRDKAAQLQHARATTEQQDPRIPYLAFLHANATPKLYWPEFKRKFKREPAMNDRKLPEKDREKLYRDHVGRLKLPEVTRKADLISLLSGVSLDALHRGSDMNSLPQKVRAHLHFISLPAPTRDAVVEAHIRGLPPAPA